MCRVLGYLGRPVSLGGILFDADSALVNQCHSPRMMKSFLNLAGFGMAAWDDRSVHGDEPFTYHVTALPNYDRNLRNMTRKLEPTCVLAHVRGVVGRAITSPQNLHPFLFEDAGFVMAHNGHLRSFDEMRYDLLDHVPATISRQIKGTTDSEWIYAMLLAQLGDRAAAPSAQELVEATVAVLEILRDVRARNRIETCSPINLFMATGDALVATRFVMDYGWYPHDDQMLHLDLPYVSLWYTVGRAYENYDGDWQMLAAEEQPQSMLIASEPLTADTSTWQEVPEYSVLSVSTEAGGLAIETVELDV
jgi:glutamine amidotransferase